MKKAVLIYPFLFSFYPIFSLYARNIRELKATVIILPLIAAVVFTLILWLTGAFVFRNIKKTSLFSTVFVFFFFSFGHLVNFLSDRAGLTFLTGNEIYFLPIWGLLFLLTVFIIFKIEIKKQNTVRVQKFFFLFTVSLITIPLIQISNYEFFSRPAWQETPPPKAKLDVKTRPITKQKDLPDIYYIIFDRYASADSLKNYYYYDNSEFINFLESKGFHVADNSFANYPITDISLASSLNMEYLDELSNKIGKNSADFTPLHQKLLDHKVGRYLQEKGYTYIHLGSTWGPTSKNWQADINYNFVSFLPSSVFTYQLLQTTAIYPIFAQPMKILENAKPLSFEALSRAVTVDQLKKLPTIGATANPVFVFAHILLPHEPYVFGQDGRFIERQEAVSADRRQYYLNQLIYGNTLIKEMVTKLLNATKKQAIIILQADEGPLPTRYKEDEYGFDWRQATVDELREKLGILNAYFLPGVEKESLYTEISPVNTFRLIFNLYFKAGLDIFADKHFVISDRNHPYDYIEVTDKLNNH